MITACNNEEGFQQMLRESARQPVLLLKHSTRCPISAAAQRAFAQFAEEMPEAACREVLVVEQRPLSRWIAAETGVAHHSPQVMLFADGKVVWHASHWHITVEALRSAYASGLPTIRA